LTKALFPDLIKKYYNPNSKQRSKRTQTPSAPVVMPEPRNDDDLSDEALITLYGRLSLEHSHLPDSARALAIARDLHISTPRLKQIVAKKPPFVNDRFSNKELYEAASAYCTKTGLVGR